MTKKDKPPQHALFISDGINIENLDKEDFPVILEGAICLLHGRDEWDEQHHHLRGIRENLMPAVKHSAWRATTPAAFEEFPKIRFGFRVDDHGKGGKARFFRFVIAANSRMAPEEVQEDIRIKVMELAVMMTAAGFPTIAEE